MATAGAVALVELAEGVDLFAVGGIAGSEVAAGGVSADVAAAALTESGVDISTSMSGMESAELQVFGDYGLADNQLSIIEESSFINQNATADYGADSGLGASDIRSPQFATSTPRPNLTYRGLDQKFENPLFINEEDEEETSFMTAADETEPKRPITDFLNESNISEYVDIYFDDEGGGGADFLEMSVMDEGQPLLGDVDDLPLGAEAQLADVDAMSQAAATRELGLTSAKVTSAIIQAVPTAANVAAVAATYAESIGASSPGTAGTVRAAATGLNNAINYIRTNSNLKNLGRKLWEVIKNARRANNARDYWKTLTATSAIVYEIYDEVKDNKELNMATKAIGNKIFAVGEKEKPLRRAKLKKQRNVTLSDKSVKQLSIGKSTKRLHNTRVGKDFSKKAKLPAVMDRNARNRRVKTFDSNDQILTSKTTPKTTARTTRTKTRSKK